MRGAREGPCFQFANGWLGSWVYDNRGSTKGWWCDCCSKSEVYLPGYNWSRLTLLNQSILACSLPVCRLVVLAFPYCPTLVSDRMSGVYGTG